MTRILAVCLGNICRSPTAEAVLRAKAGTRGMAIEVDSAGTGGWHIGDPPYGPAIDAARARGYDLAALRARQVSSRDFTDFDLILAMDTANAEDLEARRPPGNQVPVRLMTSWAQDLPQAVPDPYYTRDFEGALDLIEAAADALLDGLARD